MIPRFSYAATLRCDRDCIPNDIEQAIAYLTAGIEAEADAVDSTWPARSPRSASDCSHAVAAARLAAESQVLREFVEDVRSR